MARGLLFARVTGSVPRIDYPSYSTLSLLRILDVYGISDIFELLPFEGRQTNLWIRKVRK